MEPPVTDRMVIVSAIHGVRTLHRIFTIVVGRGFIIDDLHYTTSHDNERACVTLVVNGHLASRGLDHLCKAVSRAPDVLCARPLASPIADETPEGPLSGLSHRMSGWD